MRTPPGGPRSNAGKSAASAAACTAGAAPQIDASIAVCRAAGFRSFRIRGDTDFTQTQHLDRWDEEGLGFIFGFDAGPVLVKAAQNLHAPRFLFTTEPF